MDDYYASLRRLEETEKQFQAAVRYHPGMAYFKQGDKANARKELKRALELDPKFSGFE